MTVKSANRLMSIIDADQTGLIPNVVFKGKRHGLIKLA